MKTLIKIFCFSIKRTSGILRIFRFLVLFLFVTWMSGLVSTCFAQSPWTQKADMAAKRGWHSSCVLNGKIYSLGGLVVLNNPPTKTVQIYDPNTDNWTYGTDMLKARAGFPSCVINGKIWVFGGASDLWYSSIKSIEAYDPDSGTWKYVTDMPRARQGHTASLVDGKIYIIGGGVTSGGATAEVDVYDTLTKTWTMATPMPTPRCYLASVVLNDTIYTIGGITGSANNEAALATVQAYHPATDTWEEKAPMITPRKYSSANIIGGKIYVIGGKKGGHAVYTFATHVEMYDPTSDTWTELYESPREYLRAHSADTMNNHIYVFGGTYYAPPVVIYPTTFTCNPSIVSIPDTAFLYALIENGVDTNGDSLISYAEAENVEELELGDNGQRGNINDLTGIEAFINLDSLACFNNRLTRLDVSGNAALTYLECWGNQLTSLDLSNNAALEYLACGWNQLTSLSVSNNTALEYLSCGWNQLSSLDVSKNTKLKILSTGEWSPRNGNNNKISSLDVSACTDLEQLSCGDNQLTNLDISNNIKLEYLDCSGNQLTNLDISNNIELWLLLCGGNQLTSLDVSGCTALTEFMCDHNQLTSLDVSNNTALKSLDCGGNQLTSLDLSCNDSIGILYIQEMPTLNEICVWESFNPESIFIEKYGSENYQYNSNCGNCSAVGTDDNFPSQLLIYPNPANDLLTIQTDNITEYTIVISSLSGQLIFRGEMEGTYQLDLSSFQKGIYIITIRSKDFITTRKIIKL